MKDTYVPPEKSDDPGDFDGQGYRKLNAGMVLRLAAPHTWAGPSVLPTVFGGVYALAAGYTVTPLLWILLLATAILAQSAVNVINDWADFRSGTDTVENSADAFDAVMVYEHPDPKSVLRLGILFMVCALACGIVCMVLCRSLIPLIFGIIGAIFIICYSTGKIKISYLPLGELCSGVVMGCLIPLADICVFAAYTANVAGISMMDASGVGAMQQMVGQIAASAATTQTGLFALPSGFSWLAAVVGTIPFIFGVAMVMFTQNISDIERDEPASRKTLAVVLGRKAAVFCYRGFAIIWLASVVAIAAFGYLDGLWAAIVVLLLQSNSIRKLLTTPLVNEVRGPSMGTVMQCNLCINGAYIIAIVVSMIF